MTTVTKEISGKCFQVLCLEALSQQAEWLLDLIGDIANQKGNELLPI